MNTLQLSALGNFPRSGRQDLGLQCCQKHLEQFRLLQMFAQHLSGRCRELSPFGRTGHFRAGQGEVCLKDILELGSS